MTELLHNPKIKPEHLARKAIVYLRQSSDKRTYGRIRPLREVVWVILVHFRRDVFCCCCRCGHVGNALALSIMSTAMSAAPRARSAE